MIHCINNHSVVYYSIHHKEIVLIKQDFTISVLRKYFVFA